MFPFSAFQALPPSQISESCYLYFCLSSAALQVDDTNSCSSWADGSPLLPQECYWVLLSALTSFPLVCFEKFWMWGITTFNCSLGKFQSRELALIPATCSSSDQRGKEGKGVECLMGAWQEQGSISCSFPGVLASGSTLIPSLAAVVWEPGWHKGIIRGRQSSSLSLQPATEIHLCQGFRGSSKQLR